MLNEYSKFYWLSRLKKTTIHFTAHVLIYTKIKKQHIFYKWCRGTCFWRRAGGKRLLHTLLQFDQECCEWRSRVRLLWKTHFKNINFSYQCAASVQDEVWQRRERSQTLADSECSSLKSAERNQEGQHELAQTCHRLRFAFSHLDRRWQQLLPSPARLWAALEVS